MPRKSNNQRQSKRQNPIPLRMRTTLKYVSNISYAGAAAAYQYQYNGNGLFDPDKTGTGGQPLGFDQLATLYSAYQVTASRIRVTLPGASTALAASIVLGVIASRESSDFPSTANQQIAQPGMVNRIGSGTVYNPPLVVSSSAVTASMYGVRDLNDVGFQAVVAANPGNLWYWNVVISRLDDTTTFSTLPIRFIVELEYDVDFITPIELDLS